MYGDKIWLSTFKEIEMSKKRFSSNKRSESMFHGESTGTSFSTNYGHSDTTTWTSSDDSAQSSLKVRHAAERLDLEFRTMAKSFTVQEFLSLRAKVEDSFDSVLLSGRF